MTSNGTKVEVIELGAWAAKLRSCVPTIMAVQGATKNADPSDRFNAMMWLAARCAESSGVSEEVFVQCARQFYALCRGRRAGDVVQAMRDVSVNR